MRSQRVDIVNLTFGKAATYAVQHELRLMNTSTSEATMLDPRPALSKYLHPSRT